MIDKYQLFSPSAYLLGSFIFVELSMFCFVFLTLASTKLSPSKHSPFISPRYFNVSFHLVLMGVMRRRTILWLCGGCLQFLFKTLEDCQGCRSWLLGKEWRIRGQACRWQVCFPSQTIWLMHKPHSSPLLALKCRTWNQESMDFNFTN